MLVKGLTLVGAWHYNLAKFPQVMQVIRESPVIDLLVSHVMPLGKVQEAFELQAVGHDDDGVGDGCVVGIDGEVTHKGTVDLHGIDGEALQIGQ